MSIASAISACQSWFKRRKRWTIELRLTLTEAMGTGGERAEIRRLENALVDDPRRLSIEAREFGQGQAILYLSGYDEVPTAWVLEVLRDFTVRPGSEISAEEGGGRIRIPIGA